MEPYLFLVFPVFTIGAISLGLVLYAIKNKVLTGISKEIRRKNHLK